MRGSRVSSTGIRELIRSGRISQANRLLGRYYSLQGRVVPGQGLGRTVLFPTLNLEAQNEILPGNGVYATLATFRRQEPRGGDQRRYATDRFRNWFVGRDPSSRTYTRVTTFQRWSCKFLHRLRNEHKFPSVDELKKQIAKDIQRTKRFFGLFKRLRQNLQQSGLDTSS